MSYIRPAGLLERFHITRHHLGLDSCVISAGQYSEASSKSLSKSTLETALKKLIKIHSALSVRLEGESTSSPAYARVEKIDVSALVGVSDVDSLEVLFEQQLAVPFDTAIDAPLWRVVLWRDNTVVFAYHHAIGDGLSGLAFHRSLLQHLNKAEEDVPASHDESDSTARELPLVPAMESAVDLKPSISKIIQEVYGSLAPTSWTKGATAWTGNQISRTPSLTTSVVIMEFRKEDVSALLTQSRSHNATLTSVLFLIGVCALSKCIQSDPSNSSYRTLASCIPVSLRPVTGASNDIFCDHVSKYGSYEPFRQHFSWEEAATLSSELRSHRQKALEEIGMLKFLFGNYEGYFKGKLGGKREGSYELSNLGRFELQHNSNQPPGWTVDKLFFAQCDAVVGAAFKFCAVAVADAPLTISITYGDGVVTRQFAQAVATEFKTLFQQLKSEE